MIGSEGARAQRRGKGPRQGRVAAVAGATATALAVGLASAPSAQAITVNRDFTWDPVYTSGLLAGALNFASKQFPGINAQLSDTISFHTGPPPSLGLNVAADPIVESVPLVGVVAIYAEIGLNLNFRQIAGDTKNLYNTEAGLPQPGCLVSGKQLSGGAYSTNCRYAIQMATLGTQFNLLDAYRAMIDSVQGNTHSGLIPFTASPSSNSQLPTQTNQVLIFLQNPVRPNGGIAARFPGLSELFGIDPTMPAAGKYYSQDRTIALNTSTLDLTWAYDPIGDFPATSNLFALTNSAFSLLPINIVTGGLAESPLQGSSLGDIGLNLAGLLQLPLDLKVGAYSVRTLPMESGKGFYSTLVPNELPITMAMGFPSTVFNFALNALGCKFLLGNPIGDALAPAMKILVNTAYTDVLTPDKLSQCATKCNTADAQTWAQLGYTAYDRTFGAYAAAGSVASAATPTPINSVEILTPAEAAQASQDVFTAVIEGVQAQLAKPLWGFIVPASSASAAASTAKASRVSAPAAAESASDEVVPAEATDIADPLPSATSTPVAPKQSSVRASRGKSERVGASSARRPAASAVTGDQNDVKPAAATGKHVVTR